MTSREHSLSLPTICVGVTGHRITGLFRAGYKQESLQRSTRKLLTRIKELGRLPSLPNPTGRTGHSLVMVSPLAEGADRIVAREALALGYELHCPLPFARAEYEQDFVSEESKGEFQTLLERAKVVIELKGSHKLADKAYEAVGRWVLDHSDILLAIWNGETAAGRGGTGQIVKESLDRGLPTVWIRPRAICMLKTLDPLSYEDINLSTAEFSKA